MYGPKDGASVPAMLWALDTIDLRETTKEGKFIHRYMINYEDKSYYYQGVFLDEGDTNEHDCG